MGRDIDIAIIAVYFVVIFAIGFYFARKERTSTDYFLASRDVGWFAIGASLFPVDTLVQPRAKRRYAIVGTGDRGSGMWGRDLVRRYPDLLEFVGLCDINPKRTIAASTNLAARCCACFSSARRAQSWPRTGAASCGAWDWIDLIDNHDPVRA